jgi:transcriptional regulator with XRE-family HTH domain
MQTIKHGQITEMARKVGITTQFMWSITKGLRKPSATVAEKLEKATGIDRRAWLYPDEFHNPMISRAEASTSAVNQ